MKSRVIATASALALISATGAYAASTAYAVTELNLRAAPAPEAEIVDVIDAEGAVDVAGCIAESNWCEVTYDGTSGWAYGEYLTGAIEADSYVPVTAPETEIEVGTVTYQDGAEEGAAAGALVGGAAAAAALGGPIAIAGGMILGAGAGAVSNVQETTVTYVRENPVDPVYADGEVVVGASLPEDATLYEIPDSEYRYMALNNNTVLVDPADRSIVRIIR